VEQPPLGAGTAMDAGLAFGMRGPEDYYLLRISATHDVLVLTRRLHGHWRELREERVRTDGDTWHTLQVDVVGTDVAATVDNRTVFREHVVEALDGGVGLWARATT